MIKVAGLMLTFAGIAALAGVAAKLTTGSPNGDPSATPMELSSAFTVMELNDVLGSLSITDSDSLFDTIPKRQIEALFLDFLMVFGTTASNGGNIVRHGYAAAQEHVYRQHVFEANLREAMRQNAEEQRLNPEPSRATFGITSMADWTPEEFRGRLDSHAANFTAIESIPKSIGEPAAAKVDADIKMDPMDFVDVQNTTDLFTTGYCYAHYPVRNQGRCGDCWAFSAVEALQLRYWKEHGESVPMLSAQYLVDCDPDETRLSCKDGVKGCCGGRARDAIEWLARSGGVPTVDDYGPQLSDRHPDTRYTCEAWVRKEVVPDYPMIQKNEDTLGSWVCKFGAISVSIAADALQHYTGGVITPRSCPGDVDHAVVLVGVDYDYWHWQDGGNVPVWIIQNSWGTNWGVPASRPYKPIRNENGFVLLQKGENTCQVAYLPTIAHSVSFV